MITIDYDKEKAVNYAKRWALGRNPEYYDYSQIGGDCTNFASQCVYAGCGVMNYTRDVGWYYLNANDKSPSWTGVEYFNDFMLANTGEGPFGELESLSNLEPGDIIQLTNRNNDYYHTLVLTDIVRTFGRRKYYVCAHSRDAYQKNLASYNFYRLSCIHILGARKRDN